MLVKSVCAADLYWPVATSITQAAISSSEVKATIKGEIIRTSVDDSVLKQAISKNLSWALGYVMYHEGD